MFLFIYNYIIYQNLKMDCFTIYCAISGLPLEFSFDYEKNKNDIKYEHLEQLLYFVMK